jgi:hypothetical protein
MANQKQTVFSVEEVGSSVRMGSISMTVRSARLINFASTGC